MKKILLITAMFATMCVGVASAQYVPGLSVGQPAGLNLSWQQCDASLGTTGLNQAPTCLSNSTFAGAGLAAPLNARLLMASFIYPGPPFTGLGAEDMLVDIGTGPSGTINCWWNFIASSTFRNAAISLNFTPGTNGDCGDYWISLPNGIGASGFTRNTPHPTLGPSCSRLDLGAAGSADEGANAVQPSPGDEVLSFVLRITPAASTGPTGPSGGPCQGCLLPACIKFQQCILYSRDVPAVTIKDDPSSRDYVHWQGVGTAPPPIFRPGICPIPVPTQNKTWGSLKSLYR